MKGQANIYRGLSAEQRAIIHWWWEKLGIHKTSHHGERTKGDSSLEGWSLYMSPTTQMPPTTLRLHYRDSRHKLQQVISVTENGVNKVPF